MSSSSSSSQATTTTTTRSSPPPSSPPPSSHGPRQRRVFTKADLAVLDLVQHPIHIFDVQHKLMWWANHAAIQTLWQASSLEELLARDFGSDMSLATERRLQEYLRRFQQHEAEEAAQPEDESTSRSTSKTTTTVIRDQWTFYPNNGQYQVTAQLSLSPIYIQNDDDPNQEPYMALLNESDLHSLLVQPNQEAPQQEAPQPQEAQWTAMQGESPSSTLPTTTAEEDDHNPSTTTTTSSVGSTPTTCCSPKDETPQQVVAAQGLRGVELLRHLPVAVSQFTVQGRLMDQNPQAQHWFGDIPDDNSNPNQTFESDWHGRFVCPELAQQVLQAVQQGRETQVEAQQYYWTTTTTSNSTEDDTSVSPKHSQPQRVRSKGWFALEVRPWQDPVTLQPVLLYSAVDVTQVRQAQEAAQHANAEKSQLLAVLAHEIKTPLHQMVGFIDLLLDSSSSSSTNHTNDNTAASFNRVSSPSSASASLQSSKLQRRSTHGSMNDLLLAAATAAAATSSSSSTTNSLQSESADQLPLVPRPEPSSSSVLSEEQLEFVQCLQTSSVSLMTIINHVLEFTKLEAGQVELQEIPFDPRGVCEGCMEVARSMADKKGLALHLHHDSTTTPLPPQLHSDDQASMKSADHRQSSRRKSLMPNGVLGDPNRIRQILLNLLSNAIKFTDQGSIRLTVRTLSYETDHNQQQQQQQVLEFVVQDTGIGIRPQDVTHIFKKYTHAPSHDSVAMESGGTGLGLSICHTLAEAMNGTLTVDSEWKVGSTFTLRIPVRMDRGPTPPLVMEDKASAYGPEEEQPFQPQQSSSPPTQKSTSLLRREPQQQQRPLRILVVEDNKMNQKLIRAMLSRALSSRDTITIVDNGQMAVHELQRLRPSPAPGAAQDDNNIDDMSSSCPYDLVFMDIQMPVLNGLDATHQIRTALGWSPEDLTIVGVTASFQTADRQLYVAAGMNNCIGKPVRFHVLQSIVQQVRQERNEKQDI